MKSPTDLPLIALHAHTVYSVLDGVSTIDEYVDWSKNVGAPALGITDHGFMIGLMELVEKCGKAGLTPLPGVEFYVVPDKDYSFAKKPYSYYHLTVWAINEIGYRNLLKLGSVSFSESFEDGTKRVVKKVGVDKPRITFDEILRYNEGLVLASGCLVGSVNKALLQGEHDGAEKNLLRLLEVFRGRFYLELMPHPCTHDFDRKTKSFVRNECTDFSPDGDIQKACNLKNIELSQKHKLPLLLTVDSHFVHAEQKATQDVLLQNGDPSGWRFHQAYKMFKTDEAWEYWKNNIGSGKEDVARFVESVENNHAIASLAKGFKITDPFHQPEISIPTDIRSVAKSESEQLKLLLLRKIEENGRMIWNDKKYAARLQKEMAIICDNGIIDFSRYFLFLEHWCRWTRDHSILSAPGRGSSAGSLLCYLLKITHLNPFDLNLPFERFFSMGRLKRNKFPDIDWDMSQRDILIAKLSDVYGDKFAQCSTHGTLHVKSAIKDACRVLLGWNSQDERVEKITKTIPMTPTGVKAKDFLIGYEVDGIHHEGHLETNPVLREFFEEHPEIQDMVLRLLGIPRNVGRHASSYFISDRPIWESVPTCDIGGNVVTQYTAVPSEKAGLIKFDLLRVNTLSDISGCVRLVQQRLGHKVSRERLTIAGENFDLWRGDLAVEQVPMPDGRILDIYNLPHDEDVYKDFESGDTETIFQMNTPLLTAFCKRIRPRSLRDLSALVSLVRPGPLTALIEDGKTTMTEAYISRRDGDSPVTYVHPGLEPILKDTYGIAVYQEELQQIFSELAGYSPEEADQIRELIAKKKKQDMEKTLPEIRSRLKDRGWTDDQTQVLINLCISSASYSFNCVDGSQQILTAYGYMPMSQVVESDGSVPVAYWDGEEIKYERPLRSQEMGTKEVLEVVLENGSIIRATSDHRFLSSGTWTSLKEICDRGLSIDEAPSFLECPSGKIYLRCECGLILSSNTLSGHVKSSRCPASHEFKNSALALISMKRHNRWAWLKRLGKDAICDPHWWISVLTRTTEEKDWRFDPPREKGVMTDYSCRKMSVDRRGNNNPCVKAMSFDFSVEQVSSFARSIFDDFAVDDSVMWPSFEKKIDQKFPRWRYLLSGQFDSPSRFRGDNPYNRKIAFLLDTDVKFVVKTRKNKRGIKISEGQMRSEKFRAFMDKKVTSFVHKVTRPQKILYDMIKARDPDAVLEFEIRCGAERAFYDVYSPRIGALFEMHGRMWHDLSSVHSFRFAAKACDVNVSNDAKKRVLARCAGYVLHVFWDDEKDGWNEAIGRLFGEKNANEITQDQICP